jgi:hypothetical protein
VHAGAPLVQSIAAESTHGSLAYWLEQSAPCVQAVHVLGVALLQTPVYVPFTSPQGVPASLYVSTSHVGTPVLQPVTVVAAHSLSEVHEAAGSHATHVLGVPGPLGLHVPAAPVEVVQDVPAATYVCGTHCSWPLEQSIAAVATHGSAALAVLVQSAPCAQATHVPAVLQTPAVLALVVQDVPGDALCVTVHTGPVEVQVYDAAVAHGFVDVHAPSQRTQLHVPRIVPPVPTPVQSMV